MSRISDDLRASLIAQADMNEAMRQATRLGEVINNTLNAAGIHPATSLMARALIANGTEKVAATWWADMTEAPLPETAAAMRGLISDLPAELDIDVTLDPEIAAQNRRRGR